MLIKTQNNHNAATTIQAIVRGWLIRQQVVINTRLKFTEIATAIDSELELDRLLFQLPPFSCTQWSNNISLCLPQIQDTMLGVHYNFPQILSDDLLTTKQQKEEEIIVQNSSLKEFSLGFERNFDKYIAITMSDDNIDHEQSVCSSANDMTLVSSVKVHDIPSNKNGNSSHITQGDLVGVEEILNTHSREEIEWEIQWTLQALETRTNYLSCKKRNSG